MSLGRRKKGAGSAEDVVDDDVVWVGNWTHTTMSVWSHLIGLPVTSEPVWSEERGRGKNDKLADSDNGERGNSRTSVLESKARLVQKQA